MILFILGVGYFMAATQYPIGDPANPGPGLIPRLLGVAFMALSTILFFATWISRKGAVPESTPSKGASFVWKPLVLQIILLVLCLVAITPFGFPLSAFLFVTCVSRLMGLKGWGIPISLAVGTAISTYLLFVIILGVPLPLGTLWGF